MTRATSVIDQSEVKCKMSQNEKKGTRREAYSAQKVVRRSPPCRTGDDGLGIARGLNISALHHQDKPPRSTNTPAARD